MRSADNPAVRDAATVVLLRDGADGLESWLLTRVARMVFAASMTVFPGGRVDEADATLPWSGRPAERVAEQFGCSRELARALVGAAVREVFEETGILLSVPPAELSAAQPDVEAGRVLFNDLLLAHGLAIDADAVRPWARWVTPEGETPRRYDTHFFVAAMPDGAVAADLTTESATASWVPIAQALAEGSERTRLLMPPTRAVLAEIGSYERVADVLAAADERRIEAVRPVRRSIDGVDGVELPDGTIVVL